ncbi:hypothetical protein HY029_02780 [Candidatus Gottesmanbacteria bacterium]|nr:hypothetical protein [Candidatus Gottesmanbacteria bacterium]
MKWIVIPLICLFSWLGLTKPALAENVSIAEPSASLNYKLVVKPDLRPQKLEDFLSKYGSPLTSYAQVIVSLADKYHIDWRLVAAISGVESTFCKSIPYNSYNCWGWNNGKHAFASYIDGLEKVSETLGIHYFGKGFDTPETIGPIYAPPSPDWAWKVRYFMNLLEDDTQATFLAKQFSI